MTKKKTPKKKAAKTGRPKKTKTKKAPEKPDILTDRMKEFLDSLNLKGCNISQACDSINISRQTHYDWVDKSDIYKKEYKAVREGLKDFVESELMTNIKAGNVTAQIFWLKTQAKDRGYIEKTEVDATVQVDPVHIYLPDNGRNPKKTGKIRKKAK